MEIAFCRDHIWVHYLRRSKWIFILAVVQVDARECSKNSGICFELDSRFFNRNKIQRFFFFFTVSNDTKHQGYLKVWDKNTVSQNAEGRHSLDATATLPKAGDKGSTHPKNAVQILASSASLPTHPADNGGAACSVLTLPTAIWACTRAF